MYNDTEENKKNVNYNKAFHQGESTSLIMFGLILHIFRMDTATNLLIKSTIQLLNGKERPSRRSLAIVCLSRFSVK